MTTLEIQSSSPDIYEKIQNLDIHTIDKKRKLQIEKLIKDTESIEFAGLIGTATLEGFIKAINAILPDDQRIPDDQINVIKNKMLAAAKSEEQISLQVKYYYLTYEKASDAELSEYIAFYTRPDRANGCSPRYGPGCCGESTPAPKKRGGTCAKPCSRNKKGEEAG